MESSFDKVTEHLNASGAADCPRSLDHAVDTLARRGASSGVEISPYLQSLLRIKQDRITREVQAVMVAAAILFACVALGASTVDVTDSSFNAEVVHSKGLYVVDCYAPWCPPCKQQGPIIDALAEERTDVKFGKLNFDDNKQASATCNVYQIPCLILFKDGMEISRVTGFHQKDEVNAWIKSKAVLEPVDMLPDPVVPSIHANAYKITVHYFDRKSVAGHGTAFGIDCAEFGDTSHRYVLTARHVVYGNDNTVRGDIALDTVGSCRVVAADDANDIVLLQSDIDIPHVSKLKSETLMLLGSPEGNPVIALSAQMTAERADLRTNGFKRGMSGGPVIDVHGQIVGMAVDGYGPTPTQILPGTATIVTSLTLRKFVSASIHARLSAAGKPQ